MRQWQLVLVVGAIASISVTGGYQLQQYLRKENQVESKLVRKQFSAGQVVGTQAEEFTLIDVNGKQRSSSEWRGKVIALNFWATWCPPCREEIPHFVELQQQYGRDGLQFVGVALQEAHEVRGFLTEFNVNYPSLIGGDDVIKLAKIMGNSNSVLPYTVIIGRNGRIGFTKRGPLSKSEAKSVIKTFLQD